MLVLFVLFVAEDQKEMFYCFFSLHLAIFEYFNFILIQSLWLVAGMGVGASRLAQWVICFLNS